MPIPIENKDFNLEKYATRQLCVSWGYQLHSLCIRILNCVPRTSKNIQAPVIPIVLEHVLPLVLWSWISSRTIEVVQMQMLGSTGSGNPHTLAATRVQTGTLPLSMQLLNHSTEEPGSCAQAVMELEPCCTNPPVPLQDSVLCRLALLCLVSCLPPGTLHTIHLTQWHSQSTSGV